ADFSWRSRRLSGRIVELARDRYIADVAQPFPAVVPARETPPRAKQDRVSIRCPRSGLIDMPDVATLIIGDNQYELPIVEGTEQERAIDISRLRALAGYVTLDDGYVNTGATTSGVTFLDGEKGTLRYRGIPIEVLAKRSDFIETSWLL